MKVLAVATILSLAVSLVVDRRKTIEGVRRAARMFLNVLPSLLTVLVLVAVFLALVPPERLEKILGIGSGPTGYALAAAIGSIALIPGFAAYPLCGLLIQNGVSYGIIAVFITTLMMVGVLTLPVESKFFGLRIALWRNLLSLAGALLIGFIMGIFL
jgi:uncharacterized membrane protein YraQ (UPF0718 family)